MAQVGGSVVGSSASGHAMKDSTTIIGASQRLVVIVRTD